MDISLESLLIKDNATEWDESPPSGILTLTWLYPRVNMDKPYVTWVMPLSGVTDDYDPQLNKLQWYEKLAFRQTTDSPSIIIAEFAVVRDIGLAADIINAILGFGLMTVGGLIAQPILGSVFAAATKNIKVKDEQVTIVGRGVAEINPNSKTGTKIDISLLVPSNIEVIRANQQTIPTNRVAGVVLKKGTSNGTVRLHVN